jgi:hypothetical protein
MKMAKYQPKPFYTSPGVGFVYSKLDYSSIRYDPRQWMAVFCEGHVLAVLTQKGSTVLIE